jgi:hypothetical protein
MNIQELDEALVNLFEKRVELSQLSYNADNYDDLEETLHDMEDEFNETYGEYLEGVLQEVHKEFCSESDVLLPTAYLARKFVETPDGGIEIGKDAGVEVELDEDPVANSRLILVPSPTRIVLQVGKKKNVVWKAE